MLTIDKDIPIPTFRRASMLPENIELLETMMEMKVGESTFINSPRKSTSVFVSKRAKILGRKFGTLPEGTGTRVFCIQ
jgi:hypothetical protein